MYNKLKPQEEIQSMEFKILSITPEIHSTVVKAPNKQAAIDEAWYSYASSFLSTYSMSGMLISESVELMNKTIMPASNLIPGYAPHFIHALMQNSFVFVSRYSETNSHNRLAELTLVSVSLSGSIASDENGEYQFKVTIHEPQKINRDLFEQISEQCSIDSVFFNGETAVSKINSLMKSSDKQDINFVELEAMLQVIFDCKTALEQAVVGQIKLIAGDC